MNTLTDDVDDPRTNDTTDDHTLAAGFTEPPATPITHGMEFGPGIMLILEWVWQPADEDDPRKLEHIGLRHVVALWCIYPEAFESDPSMRKIAASIGKHYAHVSKLCSEFSLKFGFRNHHQRHAWNLGLPTNP